jgi:hypothetical protein
MKKVIRLNESELSDLVTNIIKGFFAHSPNKNPLNKNPFNKELPDFTMSDDDFYKKVLECVGAKPTKDNMLFMYAWRQAEGGDAKFNPFNTTMKMQGASDYNNKGVKNYRTAKDGIKATCDTLKLRYYTDIVDGLKDDVGIYELSRMDGLTKWGTGTLLSKVVDGYLAGASPKPKPIEIS